MSQSIVLTGASAAAAASPSHGLQGQAAWNLYWGDVGEVPAPSPELFEDLNGPCPILQNKPMAETHLVFWVPSTLNGESLTLQAIEKAAQRERFGKKQTRFAKADPVALNDPEVNKPLAKGYWVAMFVSDCAREVLKEAGTTSGDPQKVLNASCPGYELPSVREATIGCFMSWLSDPEIESPTTTILHARKFVCHTRCREKVEGQNVSVGAFTHCLGLHIDRFEKGASCVGVLPVRRY